MIIGKIPGYNPAINGNANINYENRLLNNLTITNFTPIGYSIDFFSSSTIYKIGKELGNNNNTLDPASNNSFFGKDETSMINKISSYNALKQWKQMQEGIGIKNNDVIDTFKIVATNDSTIMETLSNQYRDNFVEELTSKMANNSALSALSTGFTKLMPSIDTSSALGILSGLNDYTNTLDFGGKFGQAAKVLFGKMIGIQSAFPRIWDRSNYNNTSSLTVKLVSPSGDPDDVKRYVVDPLKYLILAASPVTFDGITYGFPPLWQVEAKGMLTMNLAGISALSISRGGPDTIFNRYNQPTNIDVRLVVEPVVAGFATPMSELINDAPDNNGNVSMIVQNPNNITKAMYHSDQTRDTSIELNPLILN